MDNEQRKQALSELKKALGVLAENRKLSLRDKALVLQAIYKLESKQYGTDSQS